MISKPAQQCYEFGPFLLDPAEHTLSREGRPVPLTPKVFEILKLLVENNGHLIGKNELMSAVWPDSFVEEGNLTRNISTLRTALGERPDEHQFIETVPKRGYRFIGEVRKVSQSPADGKAKSQTLAPIQSQIDNQNPVIIERNRRLLPHQGLAIVVLVLLGFASLIYGVFLKGRRGSVGSSSIRSLAVLPLKSIDHKDDDYVGIGLADTLITRVSQIEDLTVRQSGSVTKYATQDINPIDAGRELEVDAILEGTIQRANNQWRLNFNLIRTSDGISLWSDTRDINPSDLFDMQDRVAQEVAKGLRLKLRKQEHQTAGPIKPEALDYYWKATPHTWAQNDADNLAAIELLEQSVKADPEFGAAYAQLASVYATRAVTVRPFEQVWEEKASAAVNKALSLDPDLVEAHLANGQLLWRSGGFAHDKAIQEFRRALALNPNADEAHHFLANVYNHIGLLDKGRAEIQKAVDINPQNIGARFRVGVNLLYQCKYSEALVAFGDSSKFNPELWAYQTAWALFQLGRREEAATRIEAALKNSPRDEGGFLTSMQALFAASIGDVRTAEEKIKKAIELGQRQQGSVVSRATHFHHTAYAIASAYALLNRPRQAVDWLQDAADDGFPCYPLFEKDPNLNNIRKDERFMKLMARLKDQWEHYRATL